LGTTLKVAGRLGRRGIGYGINSDYKKIIDNVLF
jgi:DNA modification methylase